MSTDIPAASCGQAHYCLSEDQEHRIHRVRLSLLLIADLTASIPPRRDITLDPEGMACLLSSLAEALPTVQEIPFQPCNGEPA